MAAGRRLTLWSTEQGSTDMRKLSKPMTDMIHGATFYEARQDGQIIRSGYIVAGKTNTIVALIDRGLATTADADNLGMHWLIDDGVDMLLAHYATIIDAEHARMGPDLGDDIALPVHVIEPITTTTEESLSLLRAVSDAGFHGDDDTTTNELPRDAERAWDADNAAAEWSSILDEMQAEVDAERAQERAEAGLTRLIKLLDHDARIRAARRRRSKPSKQSRRPSRQR